MDKSKKKERFLISAEAGGEGVRWPWRVSLASRERSGREDEESLLRGK